MSNEADTKEERLKKLLDPLLEFFGDELKAEISHDADGISVEITGDDTSVFTGNDGKVLEALRIISASVINDRESGYTRVSVDAGGFRERKNEKITAMALKLADRVKAEGESQELPDMNSYDRRIAHMALQDDPLIRTESEGEEPHRHLVLHPA